MLIDRDKLEASICRDSLADFVQRFWPTVVPEALHWNFHMAALCEILQEAAERLFRNEPREYDIVINIPPGTSKSTIASIMFPAWVWTRMPTCRTISSSYSHALSLELSRKSRQVVQSEKWKKLFGQVEISEDQNAKGHFTTTKGGSRFATSTGGTITGFHGHFLIVDDPLDPNAAHSETDLASANRWMKETLPSRMIDKRISVTILIMQRLHQNDPSQAMLDQIKDGISIRHVNLPAEVEGTGMDVVRPRKLAGHYALDPEKEGSRLLDPVRLPRKVLMSQLVKLGQYGYAAQMLLRPTPLGGGMFKVDRLVMETSQPKTLVGKVRFWDKAGSEGTGAYTAGVKMGKDLTGGFWVLNVVRGQWDSSVRERIIKQTAISDGRSTDVELEQEPGSGGKESAQGTIRNLAGFRVRAFRPTGDKVLRADPFSVQVNAGNVHIVAGEWNRAYMDELQHFPNSSYKDQVDASSGAFSHLTRRIRVGGMIQSKREMMQ